MGIWRRNGEREGYRFSTSHMAAIPAVSFLQAEYVVRQDRGREFMTVAGERNLERHTPRDYTTRVGGLGLLCIPEMMIPRKMSNTR
jgi:hypothetical protein